MTEIAKFTARAPRKGNLDVPVDNGSAEMLARVAQVSGQLAGHIGQMADKAAIREGKEAGAAAAMAVQMPGVDFAFSENSPATTPVKPLTSGEASERASQAQSYLMQTHGMSAVAAAGIVGNLMQESSLNTGARNPGDGSDGTDSIGIAQWNSGRARNLRNFAASRGKPVGDFHTQLDFVVHELGTSESAAGRRLSAARTVEEATAAFIGYERPQGWSEANPRGGHGWQNRLAYAQALGIAPTPAADPAGRVGSTIDFAKASPIDPTVTASTGLQGDPPKGGGVSVTLTGSLGSVPQMKAGTLRGDAYNAAAMEIDLNRRDTAMRAQMDALALQYEGNPGGLTAALDASFAGFAADVPVQERALLEDSFSRVRLSLQRQAITTFNQNLESQNLAAFEENIAARTASAFRLASKAGLDATADAAIAAELGALTTSIDRSPLNPLQKSRAKSDAVSGVLSARVLGGFEAATDPAARAAYLKSFQDEWLSGEGMAAQLDVATYDRINGELMRRVQSDQVEANKRSASLDKSIEGQIDFLKKGWPVPAGQQSFLKNEVAKTGDAALAANLDFLTGLSDWQKAHIAARPEVIDAQIASLEAKIQQDGATEAAVTTLDVMHGLRDAMTKGLADDPLTWANRAGVAKVEPLDVTDGASLAASLTERVADATAIGAHYGVPPRYFTAAEADGLKKMLKQTPLALPSIVSSLSAGLGSATPAALAEISKEAPLLAHVAGLTHMTGSQAAAVEIAEALQLRATPGYKSTLPSDSQLQAAASEQIGASLAALPGTFAGAGEAAAALFETRALSRGIPLDGFSTEGSAARELYKQALDEVLGATWRDGVKYGGVTEVNGLETIAPPDIAADSLDDMLANLVTDDLLFQLPIGTANGVPIRVEQLRAGQLVMTGMGRYRIALGDVAGGNPQYVPSASGGYFELDAGMLARSQVRRVAPARPSPGTLGGPMRPLW